MNVSAASPSATTVRTQPLAARLAVLSVGSGVLLVGYAPFLHAYNAVYYGVVLPCRSIGTAWLSLPLTLAVPLLGFALVALGTGFVRASAPAQDDVRGIDTTILVDGLDRPLRLLAAVALVTGLGYAMSSEVYDGAPLEGVWFGAPRLHQWIVVALPAVAALLLGRLSPRDCGAPRGARVSVGTTDRRSRWLALAALAGWAFPIAAVARGGWDIHFDVPPGFVLVVEWALAIALGAARSSGAGGSVSIRLATGLVVADLVRVALGDSASSLIHSRSRDFTFYERHLVTVGRFVNGPVALVWIAILAGCCVALLRDTRRSPLREASCATARVDAVRGTAVWAAGRVTEAFLVLSVVWFVISMTALDLVRVRDRLAGECTASGPGEGVASIVQLAAGWLLAMGAAHLMASAALELGHALRGTARCRAVADRRAWQTLLAASLALCLVSWARLAWLALHPR